MSGARAPKTMTIPEVRDRLYALADALGSSELRMLSDQLWRRSPWRKPVRVYNGPVTDEIRDAVITFIENHPDLPEDRVAIHFGINQGRVSEIMAGKRGE